MAAYGQASAGGWTHRVNTVLRDTPGIRTGAREEPKLGDGHCPCQVCGALIWEDMREEARGRGRRFLACLLRLLHPLCA